MSEQKKTHPIRGLLGYVLSLLLAVSLTAACALTLTAKLLTDQALHERVALDTRVLDAQSERLEETVRTLAEIHHFAPETVMNFTGKDSLASYGREMVAWWMGLMGEMPEMEAPFPDTAAMEEAVREDALFCENTEDFMRRSIARDEIAYPVALAMQEAVIPLRVSLIALALPKVAERVDIPGVARLMMTARAAAFALAVALMALVLLTQGKRRWLFASAGLMTSFILLAAVTGIVAMANLPGAMAAYSTLLSLQLDILMGELAAPVLLTEGAILLTSILLFLPMLRRQAGDGRKERKGA